jgi:molybdopterin synthase sulfur carrier subunit
LANLFTLPKMGHSVSMATVEVTKHLWEFLPTLRGKTLTVQATTVAEVVREVERLAPGFSYYVCDERGCLRTHVNIFVGQERILDRTRLSDPVDDDSRVLIMQALSGG